MFKNTLRSILSSCFLIFCYSITAQSTVEKDCQYAQVELGQKKHIALVRTDTEMIDSFTSMEKGRVVDFSLVNSRGVVVLNIELYKDGKEQLTPSCIGEGASFTLVLQNGKSIVLPQVGTRLCGYEIESTQEGFYNIKNRGSFLITEDKFEDLKSSKLISGTLKADDYESYIVFKTDLYNDVIEEVTFPDTYFIRTLDCVVNPTIIVQE